MLAEGSIAAHPGPRQNATKASTAKLLAAVTSTKTSANVEVRTRG
jgi:hypothetical protein